MIFVSATASIVRELAIGEQAFHLCGRDGEHSTTNIAHFAGTAYSYWQE